MARTNFSFLQAASSPEEMVEQALRLNYQGIAVCDLNGLYGVARGYKAATSPSLFSASILVQEDFRYSIGTELTLTDEVSVCVLPMNKLGYTQLCRLLTIGKREVGKGYSKISIENLLDQDQLLCFLIPPFTIEHFLKLQKKFGDRLYIPVWRDLTWESREYYKFALRLENEWEAQLFATNRPLMHVPERKPLFDVLTCIQHHKTIDQAKNILAQNCERHLKPLDELRELWKDRLDLLGVTCEISKRLEFKLDEIRYRYPRANLPDKMNSAQYLRHLVLQGITDKSTDRPTATFEMIEHELRIIEDLEYEDYFLTLYEICQFAKQQNILFQGRGSAANSVVCYVLGLTAINPVQMGLLFERFISRERAEPPDIDIDFEHERREEVIQHIYQKYGETHAAMVCTVIRYRSKMALRETAKVFGVPLKTINALVKHMGRDGVSRLIEEPKIWEKYQISEQNWKFMLQMTQELRGFPRHLGIHTGGFLITQDPIHEMVPVEKASMQGRYVIQWNKDDVNFLKLMKIDVLSLGMLTALRKCFDLFQKHKGIDYNLKTIPQEDAATYEMACRAETVGVFQIESRAQMQTLPRLKPRCFYDLVIEVALVRPGPLQGGMVHPFLKRRQNQEKVIYAHPDLEPILKKTCGVPIFQEQVMRVVVAVAGFSPGEADELRRIMSDSWRKRGTMDGVRDRIMTGMKKHGVEDGYAEQIYKTIEGFANYGFPESHAASFALLTYASSFIKCHHPDIFVCALLNSQPMGFYSPRVLISEAQKNGVIFKNLDVQKSEYDFTLEAEPDSKHQHAVRVGFCAIAGVSSTQLKKISEERDQNGPFLSLEDFIQRTKAPKMVLLKLAAAEAFQCFHANVRELLWKIESLSLDPQSFLWGNPRENFQATTASETDSELEKEESEELIPFESNWQRVQREYQHKGFSLDLHPLKVMRSMIEQMSSDYREQKLVPFSNGSQLPNFKNKQKVRLAGLVSVVQRPPTAKGMCFITLEDEFNFMNIVIPNTVYERHRLAIYKSTFLHVCGTVERKGALINIKAERVSSFQKGTST